MHLVKPPRIAGQILDAQRFAAGQALGRPVVGIVPVEIGLISGDGRAKTESRLRSCSTGIFPLRFRRHLRHQPWNLLAKRTTKLDHIVIAHLFNRALIPLELALVHTHYGPPQRLGTSRIGQPKSACERDLMQHFVIATFRFIVR